LMRLTSYRKTTSLEPRVLTFRTRPSLLRSSAPTGSGWRSI
jgi:hypothetical protein